MQAYEEQANVLRQQGEQTAQALESAGNQQLADLASAQAAQQQAYNDAQKMYQDQMNKGYNSFSDIISGYRQQGEQEAAEMQQQINRDQQAARWTGATEMAASIANLIGVGAANASNQQYKTYSQDWMKKADADVRERRSRMDNLRERQRAMEQQLLQLKMGNAGQALSQAQRMADQQLQNRSTLSQLRYNASIAPMQARQQAVKEAGQTQLQGVNHAASAYLQERGQDISAQQHRDNLNLQLAKAGMTRDGKGNFVVDKNSEIYKANKKALQDDAHKGKNKYHYSGTNGELIPIWMTTAERDGFLQRAKAELEKRNPDFKRSYMKAMDDISKKSLIFQLAQEDEELRKELSQYSDEPETAGAPAAGNAEGGNDIDKKVAGFWGSR